MDRAPRVRIAPGPTGPFHLGRSRTAVINWLFARHHGGTFVLRIEDTDRVRSRPEHLQSILDSLRWLGMEWDEGPEIGGPHAPYFQMSRLGTYPPHTDRLLERGQAYRCYCTPEELEAQRKAAQEAGQAYRYPRTCRFLTAAERAEKESTGLAWVIRLAVPESGTTSWNDLVLGEISYDNAEMDDFIMVRSDGSPTYNFVVVVDDLTMEISHVIRGQDHVSNTPRQLLIYHNLGEQPPKFGHVPLVVGLDEKKISARLGADAVAVWGEKEGYLPEAVFNYLATVGVSYEEGREIFSREELIRQFDLDKVGRSRSKLDEDKIRWLNAEYIRSLPVEVFVRLSLPHLQLRGLIGSPPADAELDLARRAVPLEQERVRTLSEVPDAVEFFFGDGVVYDPALLVPKKSSRENALAVLDGAAAAIAALETVSEATLDAAVSGVVKDLALDRGPAFMTLRVAITGRTAAPGLFETMNALGREKVLDRVAQAIGKLSPPD
jgi:glutamyl-tRNA synthetase